MALPTDVTRLLHSVSQGDRAAVDALLPLVYNELRRLAGGYMKSERTDHTLSATALVHEAYMKLVDQTHVELKNRVHFFGVSANLMRQILVDHARSRNAGKRGGGAEKIELNEEFVADSSRGSDLIAVDEALSELEKVDPLKARIVEMRFFGGLSIEETAEALHSSVPTVNRHWRMARTWLYNRLNETQG